MERKPYKCDKCSYSAAQKRNLIRHQKHHTGEKPYKCNECSYLASQKTNLIVHQRKHTGEKPYKCNQCNYSAAKKINLIVHQRTHTGEKPYTCNQCSYSAAVKGNLIKHQRKHTGLKPYSCNQCSYSAANKSYLVKHQRKHMGENSSSHSGEGNVKFCRNFGVSKKPNTTGDDREPLNHIPAQRLVNSTPCSEKVIKVILHRLTKEKIVSSAQKLDSGDNINPEIDDSIGRPCVNRVTNKTDQFAIHQKSNVGQTPPIGDLRSHLAHHEKEPELEKLRTRQTLDEEEALKSKKCISSKNTSFQVDAIKHNNYNSISDDRQPVSSSNPLVREFLKLNASAIKEEPLDSIDHFPLPSLVTREEINVTMARN